jgi:CxxC motif-containing protein (DUF1111 family)
MNAFKMLKASREMVCLAALLTATCCFAQSDPGPRGGAAGAGAPIGGLTPGELDFFTNHGIPEFSQVESVADGLGPRFNLDSCAGCHIQPALGGSSPAVNPQLARASTMAPGNTVPAFITSSGPVREARFIRNANGSADGGVHDLFTIVGRTDNPVGCAIQQPDFAGQQANHNVIFRIPTPTFGAGLIEAISDSTIRNNLTSDPGGVKARNGIQGHVNTNGNDGTVTRFGWKAQNKSLLIFSGEAYNVEMGVTNESFQNEREENPQCATNATSESHSGFNVGSTDIADIMAFMGFMKLLDQPTPVSSYGNVSMASIINGRGLFASTGCALCHTPTLTTGSSSTVALSHQRANLFSDLAVHHMGSNLADGVTQGGAGGDEFRTAPLWGLGQRLFFLHDGRTSDLLHAINAHSTDCGLLGGLLGGCAPSEAQQVVQRFHGLSPSQKQDLLNFLRSL